MEQTTEKKVWDPLNLFRQPKEYKYAVLVLNTPIRLKHDVVLGLWEKADATITADGGTHRWNDYLKEKGIDILSGEYKQYVPNLIAGDMDSCEPYILDRLKAFGSKIVITPDQSKTDYTKALIELEVYCKSRKINLKGIFVLAEGSSRFDHVLGNINTLYKAEKLIADVQVIHVANNSLTWLLQSGFHEILIPELLVQNSSWCGLLPVGSPVEHVSTTGLKWNLRDARMRFGDLVSTSNTYDKCSMVTVKTDLPLMWTMGIEPLLDVPNGVGNTSIAN